MIRQTDYFKLGAFVIMGTAMLLLVVVALGAGRFLETRYVMETYIEESVNGLSVGSPVKLKGVPVGTVSAIGFASVKYDSDYRHVVVECELDPAKLGIDTEDKFIAEMKRDVLAGLRVKPTSLGLTGQLFLDIDFFDPKLNPPPQIDWSPTVVYIPAVPSTMNRLEAALTSVSSFVKSVNKADIKSIIGGVKDIVHSFNVFMKRSNAKKMGKLIIANLDETRKLIHRVNKLMAAPEAETIIPDTAKTVAGFRKIVDEAGDDAVKAIREARRAMVSLNEVSKSLETYINDPEMKTNMTKLGDTLKNMNDASKEFKTALTELHTTMVRINLLVAGQRGNVSSVIRDLRTVMENLKELSGDAKRYPSGLIFGTPPDKITPGGKK